MTMSSHSIRGVCTVFGCGLILSLVGCDYWPPALQAQIEQMRSETQTLTTEKAQLQAQVSDLSKAKLEVQSQMDELSRMNREKTAMIMSLQKQLDVVRAKTLKSMSSKPARRKTPAESKVNPASKVPPGKKSASKWGSVR
jgi:peptidoglycan hydrolase CwlO-like protein